MTHGAALADALAGHETAVKLPPTIAEAAAGIWPDRDQVRHGVAGQLGSAAAGLAQLAGLGICWGAAHVLFSSKSRSAISVLILIVVLTAIAIASHA